jgi:diaminopimelate epimerase
MKLDLTKHHGWGNDFLVVADEQLADVVDRPAVARAVCDRRRGVGADGLLVVGSAEGFTATMTLYNADGSVAEMSGNGIRCFAQAVARRHGHLGPQRILTGAGPRNVALAATDRPDTISASVEMGSIVAIGAPEGWNAIGAHPDRPVAHLSVGNPHTVVGVDDVRAVDLLTLGRAVPGTNLEIVEPGPEPDAITMRVHEAWAAAAWGLVPSAAAEILVHMDGGSAKVRLHDPVPGQVTLVGPAVFVAAITVELDQSDLLHTTV